jgi:hypothetical protein
VRLALAAALAAIAFSAAACGDDDSTSAERATATLAARAEACGVEDVDDVDVSGLRRARTVEQQVEATARIVERIRGLRFERRLRPLLLSRREFGKRLTADLRREYSESDAARDSRALALLGAVPRGYDLYAAYETLVTDFVSGAYDDRREQILVVRESTGKLDEAGLQTVAHELEHALADQVLGLPRGPASDAWGDSQLARAALVEGDATVLAQAQLLGLLTDPRIAHQMFVAPDDSRALFSPSLPFYVDRALAFPYTAGLPFVCELYDRGGWKAVDAAYADPPETSAEILFPERYPPPAARPAAAPPGQLARPWTKTAGTFGAADLLWLFQAPGGKPSRALDEPLERAAAWGGGRIEVWELGAETALGISLFEHPDGQALCGSIAGWYGRAFPQATKRRDGRSLRFDAPGQDAVVWCGRRTVRVGIAADGATAARLAEPG